MTDRTFDQESWERRWAQVLADHPDKVSGRPPNLHLVAELTGSPPGRALDAGCGHGAETLWLAGAGWQVTALDFSATALLHGEDTARALGADVAGRVEWVAADLGTWAPPPERYDLVTCIYVHVAGEMGEFVRRLGSGVAPGGSLFLVGHQPVDPATGEPSIAADQQQVSVESASAALDSDSWQVAVAEERPRPGGGVDAVIRAVRSPAG